jgi:hypothetical protein
MFACRVHPKFTLGHRQVGLPIAKIRCAESLDANSLGARGVEHDRSMI